MFGSIMFFHSYFRVPLIIEVWHKDSMAGNVLIGVSSASLATVLAADKVQVLSQVKKTLLFDTCFVSSNKMGSTHILASFLVILPVTLVKHLD